MDKLEMVAIDGRLNALVSQRDMAMNQYVMLAGEYAKLKEEFRLVREQLEDGVSANVPN